MELYRADTLITDENVDQEDENFKIVHGKMESIYSSLTNEEIETSKKYSKDIDGAIEVLRKIQVRNNLHKYKGLHSILMSAHDEYLGRK